MLAGSEEFKLRDDPATRWPIDTADESLAGLIGDGGRGALAGACSRNDKFGEDPPTPGSDGDTFVSIGDLARKVLHRLGSLPVREDGIDHLDTLADPGHAGDGHAVAEGLVSGTIGSGLPAIGNQGEVVGKSLKALALAGREATNGHGLNDAVMSAATVVGVESGVGIDLSDSRLRGLKGDGDLTAGVGVASVVPHAAKGRSDLADIGAVIFAGEGDRHRVPIGIERASHVAVLDDIGLPRIEGMDRHDRRSPSRPVLAGVKAFSAESVGDDGLGHPPRIGAQPGWSFGPPARSRLTISSNSYDGILSSALAGSLDAPATCCKARSSCGGKSFPRRSARRRIPRQAVALKKYRCGSSPVSKISDNEDATAPLRNSKVLSVKDSVGDAIPEFAHAPENGTKVPSASRRQDAGDVLPYQPSGAESLSKPKKLECQVATVIGQTASKSSDRERLAGGSSNKKVDWLILPALDRGEVAMQRDIGIVMAQHGARESLDLAVERRLPPERLPSARRGGDAGTDVTVADHVSAAARLGDAATPENREGDRQQRPGEQGECERLHGLPL
jgi:hypothetical protein